MYGLEAEWKAQPASVRQYDLCNWEGSESFVVEFLHGSMLRYVDLAIVLTGIKSGTLLGATVIRCRCN